MNDVKKTKLIKLLLVIVIMGYAFFLIYHINTYPNIFLDEGNCMYDSWCMAHYGVDSNLIKNPIYLPSFTGQGQSILYPKMAGIALKVFGYHLWAYRLPLVITSIISFILLVLVVNHFWGVKEAFLASIVVGTSPWLLTVSRYGMDCNIAPFFVLIGSLVFYLGYSNTQGIRKIVLMSCGAFLLGLTAYTYNVSWIYLPIFLAVLLIWLLKTKRIDFSTILIPLCCLLLVVLPILIFAIRSNVPKWNYDMRILWWTSPRLSAGRANASFIKFDKHIIKNILLNLSAGAKMYLEGTDQLIWNSVGNIGPYYMFTFPFFIFGLITMFRRRRDCDIFILSALIAMLPVMLIVVPNYNHWIFIHFPVLLTIAVGIITLMEGISDAAKRFTFTASIIAAYLVFSIFFGYQYFKLPRNTGWETSAVKEVQTLQTDNYSKVYFDSDYSPFLYFVRTAHPISPYQFQKTKDHPYSKKELWVSDHYSNFERLKNQTILSNHALIIIESSRIENNLKYLNNANRIASFSLSNQEYMVYRN
jgi:4-amino-4-deoxy-L-arabinose transferase-like glycosyltransferase